jgi:uncharacterized surface protein with fasciclin (FAS1) repeats
MSRHRMAAVALPVVLSLGFGVSAANAQSATTTTSTPAVALSVKIRVNGPDADAKRRLGTTERASTSEAPGTAWSLISTDANLSEFASLVTLTKTQALFSGSDVSTFLVPTNAAFAVLDPVQRARLSDPKFVGQAADVVRNTIAKGRVTLGDLLPQTVTFPASGTVRARTVTTPALVNRITTEAGSALGVRVFTIDGTTPERSRVFIGDAFVDLADTPITNGAFHTTDTLNIPSRLGRTLTDVPGRVSPHRPGT